MNVAFHEIRFGDHRHATANAALMASILSGLPTAHIHFIGTREHFQALMDVLGNVFPQAVNRITPHYLAPESWSPRRMIRDGYAVAREQHCVHTIFSNLTSVAELGWAAALAYPDERILMTAHNMRKLLNTGHRRVLCNLYLKRSKQLKVLVFSPHIVRKLWQMHPLIASHVAAIPLPYFFYTDTSLPLNTKRVTFGFLGANHLNYKGYRYFAQAAELLKTQAAFKIIGDYTKLPSVSDSTVHHLDGERLDYAQYMEQIAAVDYVVVLHEPWKHVYSSSATFCDGCSLLKPIIALETDLTRYNFDQMGDIGYLVRTPDDLIQTLQSLAANPDPERHQAQVKQLRKSRRMFAVESVGRDLQTVLTSQNLSADNSL